MERVGVATACCMLIVQQLNRDHFCGLTQDFLFQRDPERQGEKEARQPAKGAKLLQRLPLQTYVDAFVIIGDIVFLCNVDIVAIENSRQNGSAYWRVADGESSIIDNSVFGLATLSYHLLKSDFSFKMNFYQILQIGKKRNFLKQLILSPAVNKPIKDLCLMLTMAEKQRGIITC